MIDNEEDYHLKQFKGEVDGILTSVATPENVVEYIRQHHPVILGNTSGDLELKKELAIDEAKWSILSTLDNMRRYPNSVQCEIEREAKRAAGATHILKLQYAYPDCGPQ